LCHSPYIAKSRTRLLDDAEKKVEILMKDKDGRVKAEPFE